MEMIMGMLYMLLSALTLAYLLAAFLTAPPGVLPRGAPDASAGDPAARAAAEIQEMEFDVAAGKLSKEDFESVRRRTVAELAATLKKSKEERTKDG